MSAVGLVCRGDPEGWGPVSRIRPFDLTSCFEEAAVLSPVLAILVLSAAIASWIHRGCEVRHRSEKSVWVLRTKLVRATFCPDARTVTDGIYSMCSLP